MIPRYPRRTASLQQAADGLSKRSEMSQWGLNGVTYRELWGEPCSKAVHHGWTRSRMRRPPRSSRVAPSRPSLNSLGIDALAHLWLRPPGYEGQGRSLVYINPNAHLYRRPFGGSTATLIHSIKPLSAR